MPIFVEDFARRCESIPERIEMLLPEALIESIDVIHDDIREHFAGSQRPDGTPWPARKDSGSSHPLLNLSGKLLDAATGGSGAVSDLVTNDTLKIGVSKSTIPYAGVHQRGATIRPKVKPRLSWTDSSGKRIFAKKVVIPERKYLGLSEEGKRKVAQRIGQFLRSRLFGT